MTSKEMVSMLHHSDCIMVWQRIHSSVSLLHSPSLVAIGLPVGYETWPPIDRSHVTTAIWWPLGVVVVSVTCMRVCWVSHTWKYTQWNIFLFESSDKSPYWTNPYHIGFSYEASLNFHTYFGQCPNDIYILLHTLLSCLSKLPAHGANDCHGP